MGSPAPLDLSIIIPVYNEVESLPSLMDALRTVLEETAKRYELIFVDDGSIDGSSEILADFVAAYPEVVVVTQRRNFGKSAALNIGFHIARGAIIITMDADLQDRPEEIPTLIAKIDEGYDLVIGWRVNRLSNDPLSKTLPSRLANFVTTTVSGVALKDMNSGLKAYRSEVVKNLYLHSDLHRYIPVLAHYEGFKIVEVPINHQQRLYGQSKYGAGRYLRSLLDLMTVIFLSRYRLRPLHLFGSIGLLMSSIGLLILIYMTVLWSLGNRPIGTRPLLQLGVLLLMIGIQSIFTGLIADLLVNTQQQADDPLRTARSVQGRASTPTLRESSEALE